jgi:hypothetical protein
MEVAAERRLTLDICRLVPAVALSQPPSGL